MESNMNCLVTELCVRNCDVQMAWGFTKPTTSQSKSALSLHFLCSICKRSDSTHWISLHFTHLLLIQTLLYLILRLTLSFPWNKLKAMNVRTRCCYVRYWGEDICILYINHLQLISYFSTYHLMLFLLVHLYLNNFHHRCTNLFPLYYY